MGLPIGIPDLIAGIFKPAAELIDKLHTSKEEKLNAQARLLEVQAVAMQKAMDYEKETFLARAKIINTEAGSEHWVAATWRPTLMLVFGGMVVARFLGFESGAMSPEEYNQLWDLVQLGIGGYIVARTGEKIVREVKRVDPTKE